MAHRSAFTTPFSKKVILKTNNRRCGVDVFDNAKRKRQNAFRCLVNTSMYLSIDEYWHDIRYHSFYHVVIVTTSIDRMHRGQPMQRYRR